MPMSVEDLFCDIDDFCKVFLPEWQREQITCGERKRRRRGRLAPSPDFSQNSVCVVNSVVGVVWRAFSSPVAR